MEIVILHYMLIGISILVHREEVHQVAVAVETAVITEHVVAVDNVVVRLGLEFVMDRRLLRMLLFMKDGRNVNKKKNNFKIILYVMILLSTLIVIYLVYNFIANYMTDEEINSKKIENIDNELKITHYNGYEYILPDNIYSSIDYNRDIESFHIYSNKEKWGATVILINKQKQESGLFDNYDKLEERLKHYYSRIENRKVIEISNNSVISFEEYNEETSGLLAYMPAYDNFIYQILLFDGDDKSMNYDALDIVIDILSNGKKIEEDVNQ